MAEEPEQDGIGASGRLPAAGHAYVSSYVRPALAGGDGPGLHVYAVDPASGDLIPIQHTGTANPTWITVAPSRRQL
jgi:hypothetical protein